MRIALGCMRLSTDADRDEARALATLEAALSSGVTVLDTAHAYGLDQADAGHNERLVGRAIRQAGAGDVRVVTKCGMRRDGAAWVPDGRARGIAEDVERSLEALGGAPIDLLLLHAPDPRIPLATSARALARAQARGLVRRVGVSNVSRKQLEELAVHAPITAVEVALGAHDDLAIRSGVVAYALARGLELLAHAPLGGPKRAPRLARDAVLRAVAARTGGTRGTRAGTDTGDAVSPATIEVFLAYLLAVHPAIAPVVGARRVETVESLGRASRLVLDEADLRLLDARFPSLGALRRPPAAVRRASPTGEPTGAEIVVMMGIPGAGKSRAAAALVDQGHERLNRDTLGGRLRGIARRLDDRLREGATHLVLDNTYVTRATRHDVLRIAQAHGAVVRCVFFDTPAEEARVNVVLRMLARFGEVLDPPALSARAKEDPAALGPSALVRMVRDLEPPADDEGFASITVVPFVRDYGATEHPRGALASLDAFGPRAAAFELDAGLVSALGATAPGTACLLQAWRPGLDEASRARAAALGEQLASETGRVVEVAVCGHVAGPPTCWCRPPLPGMWLAFAHRHRLDVRPHPLLAKG